MERRAAAVVLCAACIVVGAPYCPAQQATGTVVAEPAGFVPVAIWEVRREGYPAVRHAWSAGTETMLRVSWDDGITWYGFRPLFADSTRGMLALRILSREELGRGEIAWKDQAAVTLTRGQVGRVRVPVGDAMEPLEIALDLISVTDTPPTELSGGTASIGSGEGGGTVMNSGGGGPESCCVYCEGVRACDCSVCIPTCHQSCCVAGCYCLSC